MIQVNQHFHGAIHGPVAGRDIDWSCPPRCGAASGYEQRAMDLLPASCHDELAAVIRRSDCSARDVYHACRTKALVCENGRLVRRHAWLDGTMGGLLLAAVAWMYVLALGALISLWGQPLPWAAHLQLWGLTLASVALGTVAIRQFIAPQLTARKAVMALERGRSERT